MQKDKEPRDLNLHYIYVGGIVINEKNEFLLVREIESSEVTTGKYTFPRAMLKDLNYDGTVWELLSKSVARTVYEETGIEIADGPIPFTDEALVGKDSYDQLIQIFICKYKYGKAVIKHPNRQSEIVWKGFSDFNPDEFSVLDYRVFDKANNFINALSI